MYPQFVRGTPDNPLDERLDRYLSLDFEDQAEWPIGNLGSPERARIGKTRGDSPITAFRSVPLVPMACRLLAVWRVEARTRQMQSD